MIDLNFSERSCHMATHWTSPFYDRLDHKGLNQVVVVSPLMAEAKSPTFTTGQTWGALRKAWKAYKIAKVQHDTAKMKEYATRIRTLQAQLQVPQSTFKE